MYIFLCISMVLCYNAYTYLLKICNLFILAVDLPKSILHLYAAKNDKDLPKYETQQEDRLFRTTLTFDGKKYRSSYWEKNKKFAEQGAALVCIFHLRLVNEESLIQNGSILR